MCNEIDRQISYFRLMIYGDLLDENVYKIKKNTDALLVANVPFQNVAK
jgi:hypothetical protein